MNNKRRKEISNNLNSLIMIKENFERILSDEEDSYDNIPENLYGSDKVIVSEAAMDILDEIIVFLEEAVDNIESAIDSINEIQEKNIQELGDILLF